MPKVGESVKPELPRALLRSETEKWHDSGGREGVALGVRTWLRRSLRPNRYRELGIGRRGESRQSKSVRSGHRHISGDGKSYGTRAVSSALGLIADTYSNGHMSKTKVRRKQRILY